MESRVRVLENEIKHVSDNVKALTIAVASMNESLTRYRGMFGMALIMLGALAAGAKLALSYFK